MTDNLYSLVKDGVISLYHPTGSRYICNPPVIDTDNDFVCYTSDSASLDDYMEGWAKDGSNPSDKSLEKEDSFISYKRGDVNLIITSDLNFYNKFVQCTEEAKSKNLTIKEDRIKLFQKGLYGREH